MITEVGGTVGDIEILRSSRRSASSASTPGRDNVCYVHVTLVPFIGPSGEQKTKPTQHSVTELRSRGIQPDVIVCRSEAAAGRSLKRKISELCDVPPDAVVNAADARNIYEVPLVLHEEGLDQVVCGHLGIERRASTSPSGSGWSTGSRPPTAPVRIGLIGKYVSLPDAYLSVVEALKHGGFHHGAASRSTGSRPRTSRAARWPRRLARPRRHRDPRRLRRAGHRGQDRRRRVRPRARRSPAWGCASACR